MKVLNKYRDKISSSDIYIGRGSPWGNPFKIGIDGDRNTVIEKYKNYILNKPELIEKAKKELIGKNLVCFCKPNRCHGDILIEILEGV